MTDFAETVVSHDTNSVMNLMANVHSMVAPDAVPLRRVRSGVEGEIKGGVKSGVEGEVMHKFLHFCI